MGATTLMPQPRSRVLSFSLPVEQQGGGRGTAASTCSWSPATRFMVAQQPQPPPPQQQISPRMPFSSAAGFGGVGAVRMSTTGGGLMAPNSVTAAATTAAQGQWPNLPGPAAAAAAAGAVNPFAWSTSSGPQSIRQSPSLHPQAQGLAPPLQGMPHLHPSGMPAAAAYPMMMMMGQPMSHNANDPNTHNPYTNPNMPMPMLGGGGGGGQPMAPPLPPLFPPTPPLPPGLERLLLPPSESSNESSSSSSSTGTVTSSFHPARGAPKPMGVSPVPPSLGVSQKGQKHTAGGSHVTRTTTTTTTTRGKEKTAAATNTTTSSTTMAMAKLAASLQPPASLLELLPPTILSQPHSRRRTTPGVDAAAAATADGGMPVPGTGLVALPSLSLSHAPAVKAWSSTYETGGGDGGGADDLQLIPSHANLSRNASPGVPPDQTDHRDGSSLSAAPSLSPLPVTLTAEQQSYLAALPRRLTEVVEYLERLEKNDNPGGAVAEYRERARAHKKTLRALQEAVRVMRQGNALQVETYQQEWSEAVMRHREDIQAWAMEREALAAAQAEALAALETDLTEIAKDEFEATTQAYEREIQTLRDAATGSSSVIANPEQVEPTHRLARLVEEAIDKAERERHPASGGGAALAPSWLDDPEAYRHLLLELPGADPQVVAMLLLLALTGDAGNPNRSGRGTVDGGDDDGEEEEVGNEKRRNTSVSIGGWTDAVAAIGVMPSSSAAEREHDYSQLVDVVGLDTVDHNNHNNISSTKNGNDPDGGSRSAVVAAADAPSPRYLDLLRGHTTTTENEPGGHDDIDAPLLSANRHNNNSSHTLEPASPPQDSSSARMAKNGVPSASFFTPSPGPNASRSAPRVCIADVIPDPPHPHPDLSPNTTTNGERGAREGGGSVSAASALGRSWLGTLLPVSNTKGNTWSGADALPFYQLLEGTFQKAFSTTTLQAGRPRRMRAVGSSSSGVRQFRYLDLRALLDCVRDGADVCYRGCRGLTLPVLSALMHSGDVAAVRLCLASPYAIDFSKPYGPNGQTPLHWVCPVNTDVQAMGMLQAILERLYGLPPRTGDRGLSMDWLRLEEEAEEPVREWGGGDGGVPSRHSRRSQSGRSSWAVSSAAPPPPVRSTDRLIQPHPDDAVDWKRTNAFGHDFLSLAACSGKLALVWRLLRAWRVTAFEPYATVEEEEEDAWLRSTFHGGGAGLGSTTTMGRGAVRRLTRGQVSAFPADGGQAPPSRSPSVASMNRGGLHSTTMRSTRHRSSCSLPPLPPSQSGDGRRSRRSSRVCKTSERINITCKVFRWDWEAVPLADRRRMVPVLGFIEE